jgi:hypothetical protein
MDPLTIGTVAAPVIGGLLGSSRAKKEAKRAAAAQQAALAAFAGIDIPTTAQQEITPEMLQYLQDYAPQAESTEQLGPTAMEQIALDPRLQQTQMEALEQLAGLSKGGLSEADIAGLAQVRRAAAGEAQAKQGQILQEMAARGQGGSGAELIARLKSAQSGADRQSDESLQIARMAQERALQALSQGAGLAGQVRGQQYGEQSDLAKSRDIVNQFNTQNRQNVQQRNVQTQNQAQAANLAQRQEMANRNVGLRNEAEQYNKQLLQQRYANQLSRASGMAGQYQGIANTQNQQAGRTADMYAGVGSGVGDILTAFNKK